MPRTDLALALLPGRADRGQPHSLPLAPPAELGRDPVRPRAPRVRRRQAPAASAGLHPLRGGRPGGERAGGGPGGDADVARRRGECGHRVRGLSPRVDPLRPGDRRAGRARARGEPALLVLRPGRPAVHGRGRARHPGRRRRVAVAPRASGGRGVVGGHPGAGRRRAAVGPALAVSPVGRRGVGRVPRLAPAAGRPGRARPHGRHVARADGLARRGAGGVPGRGPRALRLHRAADDGPRRLARQRAGPGRVAAPRRRCAGGRAPPGERGRPAGARPTRRTRLAVRRLDRPAGSRLHLRPLRPVRLPLRGPAGAVHRDRARPGPPRRDWSRPPVRPGAARARWAVGRGRRRRGHHGSRGLLHARGIDRGARARSRAGHRAAARPGSSPPTASGSGPTPSRGCASRKR